MQPFIHCVYDKCGSLIGVFTKNNCDYESRFMRYRVAIIDPLSRHGGMHYYDHDLAVSLEHEQFDVELFSPVERFNSDGNYRSHLMFKGVYGRKGGSKLLRSIRLVKDTIVAAYTARRSGCDAVIMHVFKSDIFEFLMVVLAKLAGLQVFAIVHDITRLDAKSRFEFRAPIVRMVTRLVVHNQYSEAALLLIAPRAAQKVAVIPHGNYISEYPLVPEVGASRRHLGIANDQLVLLFFGNPRKEKGLSLLIDALEPLKHQDRLLLLVAGKMRPAEHALILEKVEALGLNERIRLDIGHVSDEMLPVYYGAASVVVLPYQRVYESGVAIMAMTLARPILTSNLPVFENLLEASEGGYSFESDNVSSLTNAITEAVEGRVHLHALGENAYRFALEERSWAISASMWGSIIKKHII